MAINLFEAVKNMKTTKFSFVSTNKTATSKKVDKDGKEVPQSFYLSLELEDAIPVVYGQTTMYDPIKDEKVLVSALDVKRVNIYAEVLEKYAAEFTDIVVDEANGSFSGRYEGDLFFEVSNSDEVWLTDTKFSELKRQNSGRGARLNTLRERLLSKK